MKYVKSGTEFLYSTRELQDLMMKTFRLKVNIQFELAQSSVWALVHVCTVHTFYLFVFFIFLSFYLRVNIQFKLARLGVGACPCLHTANLLSFLICLTKLYLSQFANALDLIICFWTCFSKFPNTCSCSK